jgi:hypothetical protein
MGNSTQRYLSARLEILDPPDFVTESVMDIQDTIIQKIF